MTGSGALDAASHVTKPRLEGTFEEFVEELEEKHEHGAWRFDPDDFEVDAGEALAVVNEGGEVHTFTRVEVFGGGIVPFLNDLSRNPVVAPECLELAPSDFLPPRGRISISTGPSGTLPIGRSKFECCIHPWMRTIATVERD